MIELKKWHDYTNEEKQMILQYWWYYYGQGSYTLEEYQCFNELLKSNIDAVFDLVVINYIFGISNEPLIKAFREHEVEKLLNSLNNFKNSKNFEEEKDWLNIEEEFLSKVLKTLNKIVSKTTFDINFIKLKNKEKGLNRVKNRYIFR